MNQIPLHIAGKNNSKEAGEVLIAKGADINSIDIIYQMRILLIWNKII